MFQILGIKDKIIKNKIPKKNILSKDNYSFFGLGELYGNDFQKIFFEVLKTDFEEEKLKQLFKNLEGLFTIVIINNINKETIIINDKLGLKPFYLYKEKNDISFSDDFFELCKNIKSKKINIESILEILSLGYLTKNKTLVKNIKNLEPGSINIINNGKIKTIKYFDLKKKKGVKINKIYESFYEGLEKRIKNFGKIKSDITGGFDTRFILGNLLKIIDKKNIELSTEKLDEEDVRIAKKISKTFGIKHKIYKSKEKNIIELIKQKIYNYQSEKNKILTGICGGEIMGNAMIKEWFTYDNISGLIKNDFIANKNELKIINGEKKLKYGIKTFSQNILRSNINTVEGENWVNPSSYFNSKEINPFTDSKLIENMYSLPLKKVKNYLTYKSIYKKYLPEMIDIEYTFNLERENKNFNDIGVFLSKNYSLSKYNYNTIIQINKKLLGKDIILSKIIKEDVVFKKPLEVLILMLSIKRINF